MVAMVPPVTAAEQHLSLAKGTICQTRPESPPACAPYVGGEGRAGAIVPAADLGMTSTNHQKELE